MKVDSEKKIKDRSPKLRRVFPAWAIATGADPQEKGWSVV